MYAPKTRISFKKKLLQLNRDLDSVSRIVKFETQYYFLSDRSHEPYHSELSNLQRAVLFLEDRRYFRHHGLDFRAPLRIVRQALQSKRIGGISTIDAQVVRIALNRYERTLSRKVDESILALSLNAYQSKLEIFHYYLHFAYLGYRLEGVEVASRHIFGRDAVRLDEAQASFVAALFARPMPRAVYELLATSPRLDMSAEQITILAENLDCRKWANAVRRRHEYAAEYIHLIPKSLPII